MVPSKLLTVVVLLFAASFSDAAWVAVDRDSFGTTYLDIETKYQTRSGIAVWTLYDSEVPSAIRTSEYGHSARVRHEFDCERRLARTLVMVKYSQRMALGTVVELKDAPGDWEPIDPKTVRHTIAARVCP